MRVEKRPLVHLLSAGPLKVQEALFRKPHTSQMDIMDPVWTRRRRLWACGTLLVMGAGVVAYRSYSGKEPVAGWSYLQRVRKALRRYSEAFLMGSEISSLLLRDLQTFLASDAQELPQSFKQLFRLAESEARP